MSEKRKRRKWTASEKLRIVLAGMESGVEVSELCRREGVNPTMYYGWKKKLLLSSATKIFEENSQKRKAEQERSEKELSRLKDVIAEITAENLDLKNAFGLEDHGKMPPELQQRVHDEVGLTKCRSGWPAGATLAALGVCRRSYYRWLKEEAWAKSRPSEPVRPVQAYEALDEERRCLPTSKGSSRSRRRSGRTTGVVTFPASLAGCWTSTG